MNRNPISQILDRVARENMAADSDLAPRILARIQKGKSTTMQPRMKVLLAVFVALLVLVNLLAWVPGVRAAILRWIRYVPGIGLVSEGQVRVLEEPVSITRDGITLKIEQALVDSNETTVVYSVEGLSVDVLDSNPKGTSPGCYQDATLRLPEQELSPGRQVGTSWGTGYQHRASYLPIPAGVNRVTLVMPCIRSALPGKAPEDWELQFRLVPAPPGMTAFPVIEIPTPAEPAPSAPPAKETGDQLTGDDISLTLDRAVQMEDGYLIYATVHWEDTRYSGLDVLGPVLHLLDATGTELPYNLDIEALQDLAGQRGQTPLAIRTAAIEVPGPLTLVVDSATVTVTVDARFTFDPGPNPVPGQAWELNQLVDLGYGHSLRVLKVTYPTPPVEGLPQQAGFSFEMASDTGVTGALLIDKAHPLVGGGGGGGGWSAEAFGSGFSYPGAMPAGPITVDVESMAVNVAGPWQAQWTPPEPQAGTPSTPEQSACLTRESWEQAVQENASLPAGLSGMLALSKLVPPTMGYQVSTASLDGSGLQAIGFGSSPSLSPDRTRIAYIGPMLDGPADGLYVTDLASEITALLPGTARGDTNPLWSPDGQKIAFTRGPSSGLIGAPGPYNVFLMNADGSSLRQLTEGEEASNAMAWMPDGNRLLYTATTRDAAALNLLDVQTGEVTPLFDLNYSGTVVVSPDGKRLAFEERLPLDKYGLFVSDLDGSNRKLLADGNRYIVTIPSWSPDGQWVLASVHDPETNQEPNPVLTLIHVETCQIIPLQNLGGYVSSWRQ